MYIHDAKKFMNEMPYKTSPYNGRNWGHPWHSLCSYHGKLKPAIAHFLVSQFTNENDVVLDPLCGVGTIPLEACLQGRIGIGNDLSELAYIVSKAKLEAPSKDRVFEELNKLKEYILVKKDGFTGSEYSSFGFNGKLPSYFHPDTYKEILAAREYFLSILADINSAQAMLYSAFLHIIHGNRPYALSRRSHPLTPYSPQGDYIYKNVIDKIKDKVLLNYKKILPDSYRCGQAIYGDYYDLNGKNIKADIIICSPPFADSIRFYMQNWMRLWLCGWEIEDYKIAEEKFLDNKQLKNFDIYNGFFEMCSNVLKPEGKVILHLGKTNKIDMAKELSQRASAWFNIVYLKDENVQQIEKHGVKDKGNTTNHQFLFLQKK